MDFFLNCFPIVIPAEIPQQPVCKEEEQEEVPVDQHLHNQVSNSGLHQEEPKPPQMKEEEEELCVSLEGKHTVAGDWLDSRLWG